MKTILVPTDFSANAENALHYAAKIASKGSIKVILLHVFHWNPLHVHTNPELTKKELTNAETLHKTKLIRLMNKFRYSERIDIEPVVRQDLAVDGILKEAEDRQVDMIIMGTKGASGIQKVLFGSNTVRVIEKAHCPVISVPDKADYDQITKIAYACCFNKSEIESMERVAEIARFFKAQLTILHIYSESFEEEKEEMSRFIEKIRKNIDYPDISFELLAGYDVQEILEEYLKKGAADLLVLSTHQRDLLDKIIGKSITGNIVSRSKTPVLTFHFKRKESIILV